MVTEPFQQWQKAIEVFDEHFNGKRPKTQKCGSSGYDAHVNCRVRAENFVQVMDSAKENISESLDRTVRERRERNLKVLTSIVKTVIYCGRQNLPLRGHRDDAQHIADDTANVGNFQSLLEFRADSGDSVLHEHFEKAPSNATYRSKTIQNEIIQVVGDSIKKQIVETIRLNGGWFSISADEVRDCANKEQLAVTLRYVDTTSDSLHIREDFIAFIDVSDDTSGERLSSEIIYLLQRLQLDPNKMRSQCYDGAGNMAGRVKGIGPRIQRQFPKALWFWCTAHLLNRCIVTAAANQMIRNMMGTADKAARFFNDSPKRQTILNEMLDQMEDAPSKLRLREMCRTRWVERHVALEVFVKLLPAVIDALEHIRSTDARAESVTDATGLLKAMTSFDFIISLVTAKNCLAYLKSLTVALQGKQMDVSKAFAHVETCKATLQDIRDNMDQYAGQWFQEAKNVAEEFGAEPSAPRVFGRQRHRSNAPSDSPEEYYRRNLMVPFVDSLLCEMGDRFSSLHEKALMAMGLIPSNLGNCRESDFDFFAQDLPSPDSFSAEIHQWKVLWDSRNNSKPTTLFETIRACDKVLYPNIFTVLQIACIFPVTSCECERSISKLRLLKTYLRSTMREDRLTGLALMYIHRNITIDIDSVLHDFAMLHPRRLVLPDILFESESERVSEVEFSTGCAARMW